LTLRHDADEILKESNGLKIQVAHYQKQERKLKKRTRKSEKQNNSQAVSPDEEKKEHVAAPVYSVHSVLSMPPLEMWSPPSFRVSTSRDSPPPPPVEVPSASSSSVSNPGSLGFTVLDISSSSSSISFGASDSPAPFVPAHSSSISFSQLSDSESGATNKNEKSEMEEVEEVIVVKPDPSSRPAKKRRRSLSARKSKEQAPKKLYQLPSDIIHKNKVSSLTGVTDDNSVAVHYRYMCEQCGVVIVRWKSSTALNLKCPDCDTSMRRV
jgi:hypothetical protein